VPASIATNSGCDFVVCSAGVICCALAQFTLSWREAKRIDFGTILLFGGGLALGDLMFTTGLSEWVGERLSGAINTHDNLWPRDSVYRWYRR
jgi:di/tricarboxylate transporter